MSQIVMCTNHRPDFNAEEVASVEKDRRLKDIQHRREGGGRIRSDTVYFFRELMVIVEDMADHLPKEDPSKGIMMDGVCV